ncbi:hypothetical protein [Acinetobacter dispersus]|uniref:hypothetical protein n=1 Tax=Acinetobacter dispersus TaxID=70348 RepID=UPI0021CD76FC|nr:hypothetical protein [Acinetobacter dispersus]MCU4336047.1 hypothetical protein [Acinetobacter dispersus]
MHPLLSKINYTVLTVISCVICLVSLGVLFILKPQLSEQWYGATTNIIISIITCLLVSFWWNKLLLDASDHYNKSGIKFYYNDFSEVDSVIKEKIRKSKETTIFFMYGKTFINGTMSQIKEMLSRKNSHLTFIIADVDNKFIAEYERFWDYKIKDNIKETPDVIENLFNEIDLSIRGRLQIYLYRDGCYSYSYYKIDGEVFLSPNKMVVAKSFKPITIHAKKTLNKNCLYNKVNAEFSFMVRDKQIELVYDSDLK